MYAFVRAQLGQIQMHRKSLVALIESCNFARLMYEMCCPMYMHQPHLHL